MLPRRGLRERLIFGPLRPLTTRGSARTNAYSPRKSEATAEQFLGRLGDTVAAEPGRHSYGLLTRAVACRARSAVSSSWAARQAPTPSPERSRSCSSGSRPSSSRTAPCAIPCSVGPRRARSAPPARGGRRSAPRRRHQAVEHHRDPAFGGGEDDARQQRISGPPSAAVRTRVAQVVSVVGPRPGEGIGDDIALALDIAASALAPRPTAASGERPSTRRSARRQRWCCRCRPRPGRQDRGRRDGVRRPGRPR